MDDNTITGRLLKEAQGNIDSVIRANNLSQAEKTLLEGQKLILKFINEDHAKTKEMYEDFADRKKARERWSKFAYPVGTAIAIGFVSQFIYFWLDVVPKLQNLP